MPVDPVNDAVRETAVRGALIAHSGLEDEAAVRVRS